jgi:hypothetical protein
MIVSKPLIIIDDIHVYLFQVAWLTCMQMFISGGFQTPIKKVNVYASCSCPTMATNSFGMHIVNLLLGLQV